MVSEVVVNSLPLYTHEQIKQIYKEKLAKNILSFYSGNVNKKAKNVIFDIFLRNTDLIIYYKRCKVKIRTKLKMISSTQMNNSEVVQNFNMTFNKVDFILAFQ